MTFCNPKQDDSARKVFGPNRAKRSYQVVISNKRFQGIKSRAYQEKKLAQIAAVEEERHYREYLKEGNDLLCSYFKENVLKAKEKQEQKEKLIASVRIDDNETKLLQDHLRRERILRANKMLEGLKPGPRSLHSALLESDMIYHRHHHEALNREIAQAESDQQKLDEQQCPEILIPFANVTEAEVVAQEKAKIKTFRNDVVRDMSERCKRREEARFNELYEGAMERVQCEKMVKEEEKAAKELKARKHDFGRKAYRDAVKEKAKRLEHERICNAIDDRRDCVYQVANRNLNSRYNAHVKKMRDDLIASREARAVRICQMQQAKKREASQMQLIDEDRYDFEVKVDEERRQCQLAELAKQRKAYQIEEKKLAGMKLENQHEIKRFEIARRLKNSEANKHFNIIKELEREKVKKDLRDTLYNQRDEFIEQRKQEMMRISECNDDPYLEDDKRFFAQAVDIMEQSREIGRPLYPIAMAADRYRIQNKLDMRPEARVVRRSKLRDYCWPGYVSKADMAYRKYEQREKCQEANVSDHHQIYCDSIKIQKMAAIERPYKQCQPSYRINCFKQKLPIPAINNVDCKLPIPPMDSRSNDPPGNVQSEAKSKMMKVMRKVIDDVKKNSNDQAEFAVPEPVLIEVSANAVTEQTPSNKKNPRKQRGSQSKQSGFSGGPLPGQNRLADIPNPKGSWGDGPLKPQPIQQIPKCCRPVQPARQPASGQNRPAPIPNPKGNWGSGSLPQPSQQMQKSHGPPRLKLM